MKAHQRIIREKKAIEDKNDIFEKWWQDIDCSKDNAVIKEIDRKTALPIILDYEWLGTLPVNYKRFCGLYFNNVLSGVICFVEVKFGGKFTLWNYPAVCLGRGACTHWCPNWCSSYLIQNGLKLLYSKDEPKYVVAFSDWGAGELGTIYQACNWVYLGHKKTKEWVDKNNKRYDINTPSVRAVSGFARRNNKKLKATKEQREEQKKKMIKNGYKIVDGIVRGKYATVVGKKNKMYRKMKKLLIKNSKNYVKRNYAGQVSREIRNISNIEGECNSLALHTKIGNT
jgi:hypothetical protein